MKFFTEKRFVYQQAAQPNPEVQSQPPPVVEAGNEAPKPGVDLSKEALPSDPAKVSEEIKSKGKQQIGSANDKLSIFENLKIG